MGAQREHATGDDLVPETTPLAYTPKRFAELISASAGETISERTVRQWCSDKKIPGACRIGKRWIIPASAVDRLFGDLPPNVSLFPKR